MSDIIVVANANLARRNQDNIFTGENTFPSIQFDTTATPITNAEGLLQWNATDGTLDLGMDGGDITQQIGQEMFMKVRNVSGSTILNGSPVYVSGRTGNRPNIYLCKSDADATSNLIGLTTQDINSPDDGFVTTFGYVRQIKTNYSGAGDWGTTWSEGDKLYVSKTVAGQLTNVEPSAPHHSDIVGMVEIVGAAGIGSILVNPQIHKTLEELTDVDGTALTTTGQIPVWNETLKYFDFNFNFFRNKVETKSGDYTLAGTDQVVVFTATATATLPSATGSGQTYRICNEGLGVVTIDAGSGGTIKGSRYQYLSPNEDIIVTDYQTNKYV